MAPSQTPGNGFPANQRLDGWKEIASYVGRGIRTAQRWERELGMPVHRLNTGAAEVVYANPAELDEWLHRQSRSELARIAANHDDARAGQPANGNGTHDASEAARASDQTRPRPGARRWWIALGAACTLAAAAFAGGWLAGTPGPAAPPPHLAEPASLLPAGDSLSVLGPQQELLWQHRFTAPITEYSPEFPSTFRRAWDIRDIDNDGSSEILFARANDADPRIYCFNRDGSVRFAKAIDSRVRFGSYACPPVMLTHVFADPHPDFPRTFFVVGQHPLYFPAVVRRLDADGTTAGEYWSNGYVTTIANVELGGRRATLVGGANNETGGASLAVFFGNIGGSAPAARPEYRCEGCAPGAPDIFLTFPRSRLQEEQSINAAVYDITVIGPDRLSVGVVNAGLPDTSQPCCGWAYYTLDQDYRIVATELGGMFEPVRRKLEEEKRVTAATTFRDPDDFYPVRRWNGSGWDLIAGPERTGKR